MVKCVIYILFLYLKQSVDNFEENFIIQTISEVKQYTFTK